MHINCVSLFSKWAEGLLLDSIHRSRAVYGWPYSYGNLKALHSNGGNKRTKAACWYDGHGHCGVDSFETNDLEQRRHSHYKLEQRLENSTKNQINRNELFSKAGKSDTVSLQSLSSTSLRSCHPNEWRKRV